MNGEAGIPERSHISPIKLDEIFSCELIIPRFNFHKIEAPAIHKGKYGPRGKE